MNGHPKKSVIDEFLTMLTTNTTLLSYINDSAKQINCSTNNYSSISSEGK